MHLISNILLINFVAERQKKMQEAVLGVDLGGTHIYAGVADTQGKILNREAVSVQVQEGPARILEALIETARKAMDPAKTPGVEIRAIGVGIPGSLDTSAGICHFSPNFPGWRDIGISAPIQNALGLPTFILNDVRCATLGEQYFGAGKGFQNFVCLAIGTGIGGGLVLNGTLYIGASGGAGEVGHMCVLPDGPRCNCGSRGCMEAIAAGPAITARAQKAVQEGRSRLLAKASPDLAKLTPKDVANAALRGDTVAINILQESGRAIGIGIANLITVLNPQRVIVGGGVAQAGELLMEAIRKEVSSRVFMVAPSRYQIVATSLGPEAGLVGSATLAMLRTGLLA